jgi:hypothetical protein
MAERDKLSLAEALVSLLARLKFEGAGRRPHDPLVMLKALLLRQWYPLSDAEAENCFGCDAGVSGSLHRLRSRLTGLFDNFLAPRRYACGCLQQLMRLASGLLLPPLFFLDCGILQ